MEAGAATDIAGQIKDAFTSSFNQGVEGATEIEGGEGPLDAIASGLKVESGVAGALFSPIAPLTNLIGQGIKLAGNALADTPLMQKYAATATPADIKVLTALQNLGTVAMAIVGAKAGDEVPPEQLESVANEPKVIEAAKQVVEARKAAEPAAQAEALPVKETPNSMFPKSAADPAIKDKINTGKATEMDPVLRNEIRNAVNTHGAPAAHAALKEELGAGDRQAAAHIGEAPTPQNAAEELTAHQNALRTAVGDQYLSPDKMSVIKMGPKAKPSIDTIDAVTGKVTKGVEPKEDAGGKLPQVRSDTAPKVAEEKAPTIDRPVDESGQRVTKAANDINEALVKKGLDQIPEDLQSKYTSGSYKDSVAKVTDLMGKDIESVKTMAKTGEGIPEGVHPQILFNAMEAYATKNADVGLLRDLAQSPLGTKLSEAGGELGSHGFNDNPNSAISKIREVSKAREEGFSQMNQGKKAADEVKSTAAELKSVRQASAPKIKDWNTFVKSLQC